MKALTLHRPWPWAIFDLPPAEAKRVENRTWTPPRYLWGQRFAIHAGKTWDAGGYGWMRCALGLDVPMEHEHPIGIIGTARLAGCRDASGTVWSLPGCDKIIAGPAAPIAPPGHDGGRWFAGPVGWLLDDVRPTRVVPCKGAQGLWTVPPAVEAELVEAGR